MRTRKQRRFMKNFLWKDVEKAIRKKVESATAKRIQSEKAEVLERNLLLAEQGDTGIRLIPNRDCFGFFIYQKQDPLNVPPHNLPMYSRSSFGAGRGFSSKHRIRLSIIRRNLAYGAFF